MREAVLSAYTEPAHGLDAWLFARSERPAGSAAGESYREPAAKGETGTDDNQKLCDLVERISRSDQHALSALYDATVGRVFSVARCVTRNAECAEEVTADVYWQVWRQALRFDPQRGPVMAWLLMLARSRALDHLRRRDEAIAHPEPETLMGEQGQNHLNPARLLSSAQTDRCLNAALERLEPLPRQLLSLAFYRGLTHDEIAKQTQLPLGSVKSHIRRGLSSLQRLLLQADSTGGAWTS